MVGVSAVPTVICAFVFEAPAEQAALSLPVLAVLIYHIGFPMIVCHAVWVSLVGRLPASVAAIATLLIPVVGVISAALLLGDELGAGKLVALALVLLSVALTFFQWGWFKPIAGRSCRTSTRRPTMKIAVLDDYQGVATRVGRLERC